MKRSDEEIQKEVDGLKEIKPKVRRKSLFGDDHHAAIDAQIEVLEKRIPRRVATNRWLVADMNINEAVIMALDWLDGEPIEYDGLVESWRELVEDE